MGKRLIGSDRADAASALGEIRAFGTLLHAGFEVEAVKRTTTAPDFEVSRRAACVAVEVQTRQLSDQERKELESAKPPRPGPRASVAFTDHVITPFGKPRPQGGGALPSENATANVIQRIAQTKLRSGQLGSGPSVLWIDFQDEHVGFATRADIAVPLSTSQGRWWSGALWYAAYGWKGAPLFEGAGLPPWTGWNRVAMAHEGRFKQGPTPSLIVASFEDGLVALEHPHPEARVPRWFLGGLMRLAAFLFELSWLNWPAPTLQAHLGTQRMTIESLARRVR